MERYSRTDPFYSDTHPQAMKVWIEILRKKTPGEKMMLSLQSSDMMLSFSEAGVRGQYPNASEREVFLRAASRYLSRDQMVRVYGWDPCQYERKSRSA